MRSGARALGVLPTTEIPLTAVGRRRRSRLIARISPMWRSPLRRLNAVLWCHHPAVERCLHPAEIVLHSQPANRFWSMRDKSNPNSADRCTGSRQCRLHLSTAAASAWSRIGCPFEGGRSASRSIRSSKPGATRPSAGWCSRQRRSWPSRSPVRCRSANPESWGTEVTLVADSAGAAGAVASAMPRLTAPVLLNLLLRQKQVDRGHSQLGQTTP